MELGAATSMSIPNYFNLKQFIQGKTELSDHRWCQHQYVLGVIKIPLFLTN